MITGNYIPCFYHNSGSLVSESMVHTAEYIENLVSLLSQMDVEKVFAHMEFIVMPLS